MNINNKGFRYSFVKFFLRLTKDMFALKRNKRIVFDKTIAYQILFAIGDVVQKDNVF